MSPSNKQKRVFGRKLGRPLNASRQAALDYVLPLIEIDQALLTEQGNLDPISLFLNPSSCDLIAGSHDEQTDPAVKPQDDSVYKQCWLEIGFGTGEHLSALMRRHPDIAWFGAEPFINGMSAFCKDIKDEMEDIRGKKEDSDDTLTSYFLPLISNVRVLMNDAMLIVNSLRDNSLDGIYVLNPDPWHKKRHYKRRMINQNNLDCFARILKPGGELIMSTDVPDLADWMVTQASMHDAFEWSAQSANDWRIPPEDWVHTAYETKRAKNADKMVYLFFRRA